MVEFDANRRKAWLKSLNEPKPPVVKTAEEKAAFLEAVKAYEHEMMRSPMLPIEPDKIKDAK